MGKDVSNDLSYYLLVNDEHKTQLAAIRAWANLKIAFDGNQIWVKDFDYVQINALELKSMPYKTLFYEKNGKLFLLNSALPDRNTPSLLWTPMERALPIELPKMNHNFFGIEEKINIKLIPSEIEVADNVMITSVGRLRIYITTAPSVRTQNITWALLNDDKVILLGTPLLPISGDTFWQRGDFLIPSGYDFDLYLFSETLNQTLNPEGGKWVIWNTDSTYFLIDKDDLEQLSLGSFRRILG